MDTRNFIKNERKIKMIVANINDTWVENYKAAHPRFKTAFNALKKFISENAEVGKYEIDGENVFAMVQEYETKTLDNGKFEMHKKYIDIQYIVSGKELMGNESQDKLTPISDYKPDIQLFSMNDSYDKISLSDGEFAIFFPEEPHAPGLAVDGKPSAVKKIVVKVLA